MPGARGSTNESVKRWLNSRSYNWCEPLGRDRPLPLVDGKRSPVAGHRSGPSAWNEEYEMRVRIAVVAAGAAVLAATASAWPASAATEINANALAVARQALPAKDGWASSGAGTTGGSTADAAHVYVVHNRPELIDAIKWDPDKTAKNDTPKIILVDGTIDGNDDGKSPVSTDWAKVCKQYEAPGYDFAAFLAKYDPDKPENKVEPKTKPDPAKDPLEAARKASAANQAARVMINLGSNTTILGLAGAKFTHANLMISGVSNVIVRNLTFEDAKDCFPVWDPTDGTTGNWNSAYDTLSIIGSTNVWVDHNEFNDGNSRDSAQKELLGRPFQVHDGLLDITKVADLVTVSYNYLHDHDKTMLIGSSDPTAKKPTTGDEGKLRVTMHHNRLANLGQRVPRVRFGQVDVYNNHYTVDPATGFLYSWGVGSNSAIYAEKNFFDAATTTKQDVVIFDWRKAVTNDAGVTTTYVGTITDVASMVRTAGGAPVAVNLLDAYNAANKVKIGPVVGWTPDLRPGALTAAADVPTVVDASAGVGKLWSDPVPAAPGLPVTGFQTALAASIGAALLAAGGALFLVGRRRRRITFAGQDHISA
jgi:pectate lyase